MSSFESGDILVRREREGYYFSVNYVNKKKAFLTVIEKTRNLVRLKSLALV